MKALSMMQPYAWLFSRGILTVDDRTWSTMYRGPVAIHASKGFHQAYYDFIKKNTKWQMPDEDEFVHGGIVAVATLVDCQQPVLQRGEPQTRLELRRAHFGAPGHYGFMLENIRPTEFKSCRGNRGLFDIPESIANSLVFLKDEA